MTGPGDEGLRPCLSPRSRIPSQLRHASGDHPSRGCRASVSRRRCWRSPRRSPASFSRGAVAVLFPLSPLWSATSGWTAWAASSCWAAWRGASASACPRRFWPRPRLPATSSRLCSRGHPAAAASSDGAELRIAEPLAAAEAAPDRTRTLVEVLEWHAQRDPNRRHVLFLPGDGDPQELTYAGLLARSRAVAAGLARLDVAPGQAVGIMLPTGLEYFAAFFGVQLAGGVPVPLYPPARRSQVEDHLRRQAGILQTAGAEVLVTFDEVLTLARLLRAQLPVLRKVVTVDELSAANDTAFVAPAVNVKESDLAFLQFTSGSTGNPKGVMLTHANLLANLRAIQKGADVRPDDVDRELAAALPRHGADRLLDGEPLLRRPPRPHVAADLPGPARALAEGDPEPPRHALRGPELRLRAVRQQDSRQADRGARPLLLAHGAQRRRAGEPRGRAALHRALHALRLQPRRPLARLRPGREARSPWPSRPWAGRR